MVDLRTLSIQYWTKLVANLPDLLQMTTPLEAVKGSFLVLPLQYPLASFKQRKRGPI